MKSDALWERVVQAESRAARAEAELAQIKAATEARLEKQRIRKQRFTEKKEKERAGTSENATERSGTLPSVPAPSSPPSPSSPTPLLTTSSPPPQNSANAEASGGAPSLVVEPKEPPPEKPKRESKAKPWMGEINRVWTEVYPDSKAPLGAAKMLSPIVDKFGVERVAAELGKYLRATEAAYLSVPKFCSTFGGANRDAKAQSPTAYAARLIRFYVEHGFSQVLPIEQHDKRIDELAAEHKIKDPDRVKRELRIVAPWMTLRGMKQGESARYEERVAKLLQDAPGVAA